VISRHAAKYLWDASRAAEAIARYTAGRDYDTYLADDMLRAAVERQFEVIGEAFTALRRIAPDVAASIPQLPQAVAFRNVLIHGYATLSHRRVWSVVDTDLQPLRHVLARLLANAPPPSQHP
jgi:uncharacterized protein with HEPN domain